MMEVQQPRKQQSSPVKVVYLMKTTVINYTEISNMISDLFSRTLDNVPISIFSRKN
jgi:hypothetical protein